MRTLYITDLDGTFLDNYAKVTPESKKIINELSEKGLLFSVATARSLITVTEIIDGLNITAPAVLMSGVFMYDYNTKKAIKYFDICKDTFYKLIKLFESYNKSPFVFFYSEDGELTIDFTELRLDIHREFYSSRKKIMGNSLKQCKKLEWKKNCVPLFFSLCDVYKDLKPISLELDKMPDVSYSFYQDTYTDYWFLEVFNFEASKAKGLEIVRDYIKPDKVIAFGDNLNDIPLFSEADKCYAVENAVPELKQIATGTIRSNVENGVCHFIENDFVF